MCTTRQKCRVKSCSCRRPSWPVLPLYLSAVLGDLSRGSGQFVRKVHSAIEHLTRSRAVSRRRRSFSCRFLSWLVRQRPPASLYAFPARAVSGNARSLPRLHTPSSGSLSATPAGMAGSGESTHAPLCVPYAAAGASARRNWQPSASRRAVSPLVISRRREPCHDENSTEVQWFDH